MIADGLTKGKCERDSVATAMGGVFTKNREVKSWTAPQAVYSEAALLSTSTGSHQDRSVAVGRNGLTLADDSIGPTKTVRLEVLLHPVFARLGLTLPCGLPKTEQL